MGLSASPFSFRDQLAFYGAYHTNRVNVFIHMVCVPLIWMSALAMVLSSDASLTGLAYKMPPTVAGPMLQYINKLHSAVPEELWQHLNLASVVAFLYLAYYYTLDVASAVLITPLWIGYYALALKSSEKLNGNIMPALIVFVVSWILQFYGHGVHEGRAPALLDNLLGAVVLAPLFVFVEMLFFLGYRPELQKWLKNETGRLIVQFRATHPAKPKTK